MKKADRKLVKADPGQSHAEPYKNSADNHKRYIEGNVSVRGQVEIHVPPEAAQQDQADRDDQKSYRKKNYLVSLLTLLAVIVYAFVAFWQGYLTRDIANTAQKQLISSIRPWIGADEKLPIITGPIIIDPAKHITTQYQLSAMSYGDYAANNLQFWAQLYVAQDITTIYERERYACDQTTTNADLGRVLFPKQERIMSNPRIALAMDITPNAHADPPQTDFSAFLLTCIGYRDHAGNPYHTGIIYRAVRPGTSDSATFELRPDSHIQVEWREWYSFID